MRYLLIGLLGLGCAVQAEDTPPPTQREIADWMDSFPRPGHPIVIEDDEGREVTWEIVWINPPELQAELDELRRRIAVLECKIENASIYPYDTLDCTAAGDAAGEG